jgi:hypothetical protein
MSAPILHAPVAFAASALHVNPAGQLYVNGVQLIPSEQVAFVKQPEASGAETIAPLSREHSPVSALLGAVKFGHGPPGVLFCMHSVNSGVSFHAHSSRTQPQVVFA